MLKHRWNSDVLARFHDWFRPTARVLLVVPPFASVQWPSIGVHLLQAEARAVGHPVQVLYANALFAAMIGVSNYTKIAAAPRQLHLSERMFCATAYDLPTLGATDSEVSRNIERFLAEETCISTDAVQLAKISKEFTQTLAESVIRHPFQIIGCTSSFQQNLASLAFLKAIKGLNSHICTVLGGANCEGIMAEGLSTAAPMIDHLFSGEAEITFPKFIQEFELGIPQPRIIRADQPFNLDQSQLPDYSEYFDTLHFVGLELNSSWLPYESSRGCWWGEKHHCTFCGLNGLQMEHRAKSAHRVLVDLGKLLGTSPVKRICMVDNIMPLAYHRSLVPRLRELGEGISIFYEQKANLSLKQVKGLVEGGITVIQPGIESLSTSLLKRMRKGVSAAQNIALLRYALACGLSLNWNLLHSMPGDKADDYREMIDILPALAHLQPPSTLGTLSIDRFSPYFNEHESFGIYRLRPNGRLSDLYPAGTDIATLAYHFEGDYLSGFAVDEVLKSELFRRVDQWQDYWSAEKKPMLVVVRVTDEKFMIVDTRPDYGPSVYFVAAEFAAVALAGTHEQDSVAARWAMDHHFAVCIEGQIIPLAVATPELIELFSKPSNPPTFPIAVFEQAHREN